MELTQAVVEKAATAYAENEPLYVVEAEEIEGLGPVLATGEFGWRDAEWVVQWYYRRRLGAFPNDERRAREAAYDENDYETVRDALMAAAEAETTVAALEQLLVLKGVDVGVASAFLMFIDPANNLVVSDREWRALAAAGELSQPMPDPLEPPHYASYLEAGRTVGDRLGCDMWTLYRALWRLGSDA